MNRTKDNDSLKKVMMSVLLLALVRMYQGMIVVQGLPLNVALFSVGFSLCYLVILRQEDQEAFLYLLWWH